MSETTMQAGRALDALVAEKVFGAIIHEGQYDDYMTLPGERPVSDQRPVPAYSTDIAAAWLVAESEACERAHKFSIEQEHDVWYCCVSGMWEAEAPTAPLAICLAALKKMEDA